MKTLHFANLLAFLFLGTVSAEEIATKASSKQETIGTSQSVDAKGTKNRSKLTQTSEVNSDGKREDTTEVETSKDPKGLGNKSWTETKANSTEEGNGSYKSDTETSSVDSKGTARTMNTEKSVTRNADGTSTTRLKEKLIRDPKGLNNRSVDELNERVKKDAQGRVLEEKTQGSIDEVK